MSQPAEGIESELLDLTEVSLADLPAQDPAALAPMVARIARRIESSEVHVSDYQGGARFD